MGNKIPNKFPKVCLKSFCGVQKFAWPTVSCFNTKKKSKKLAKFLFLSQNKFLENVCVFAFLYPSLQKLPQKHSEDWMKEHSIGEWLKKYLLRFYFRSIVVYFHTESLFVYQIFSCIFYCIYCIIFKQFIYNNNT